jgi:hypothetical protein
MKDELNVNVFYRLRNVTLDELEPRLNHQGRDVIFVASDQIIYANDIVPVR